MQLSSSEEDNSRGLLSLKSSALHTLQGQCGLMCVGLKVSSTLLGSALDAIKWIQGCWNPSVRVSVGVGDCLRGVDR